MQHLTVDLENTSLELIIMNRHIVIQKIAHIRKKMDKSGQEVMYSSKKTILTTWSLFVMKHVTNSYGYQVKVIEIQIQLAKNVFQK